MSGRWVLAGRVVPAWGFLFDKDGTLLTFAHWRAVMEERARRLAEELNLSEPQRQALARWMGGSSDHGQDESWGLIPLPRPDAEQAVAERLATVLGLDRPTLHARVARVFREVDRDFPFEHHLQPTPGAEACLRAIRRGGGRSAVVTHDVPSAAGRHLAALGWDHLVDVVIGLDGTMERKPSPQPLLAACRALGVPPEETVMVGDTVTDLVAGRAAGCALTVGVLTGLDPREKLAPHADIVAPDLATLGLACAD